MGLFDGFRQRQELDKLEKEAARNPGPISLTEYAERLMSFGQQKKAADIARKALEQYPDNERVRKSYQLVMKSALQTEIVELQKSLASNPNAKDYERLAMIYMSDLKDRERALDTVREGLEKFEGSPGLNYVNGLVRFYRYHEDFIVTDGTKALERLIRCLELNPDNYKARLLVSRLYGEIGVYGLAREQLEKILASVPGDETATGYKALLDGFGDGKDDVDFAFSDIRDSGGLSEEGITIFKFFDPNEPLKEKVQVNEMVIQKLVESLGALEGFKGGMALTDEGTYLAGHAAPAVDQQALGKVVFSIFQTVQESSRRLDIGNFVRGVLDSPIGRLHIVHWKNIVLSCLTTESGKAASVESELDRVLDSIATK